MLRKSGRPLGSGRRRPKYQVTLDSDDAEWGKTQPGGLSDLLRNLLRDARSDSYWLARAEDAERSGYMSPEDSLRAIRERMSQE